MRVSIVAIVPKQDFLTVGEKDIRYAVQLLGISPALCCRFLEVDRGAFRFDYRHRPAVAITQHVIGERAVR